MTTAATVYRMEIPRFRPALLNTFRGRHWRNECRKKKEAADTYAIYARLCAVPKAVCARIKITITGWERGGKFPDVDAPLKVLLDALVRCGLLLDDGPKGLVGMPEVVYQRGPDRTVIELEDVP